MTPALRWVLVRAFAPPGTPAALPDGSEVIGLARRLSLSGRIAARHDRADLAREIGDGAAELRSDRTAIVAHELRLQHAWEDLLDVCRRSNREVVPIKGMALILGRFTLAGARPTGDLDFLVGGEDSANLQRALVDSGRFVDPGAPGYEHQAPMLRHRSGGAIELHRFLLGVRLTPGRSTTLEELSVHHALLREPLGSGATVLTRPSTGVLAAHALAHAIAQNASCPGPGGPLLFADLIELGFADAAPSAAEALKRLLSESVSPREVAAALDACAHLHHGELGFLSTADDAALLTRHFLCGALDAEYTASLRLHRLAAPLSDRSGLSARWRSWSSILLPTRRGAAEPETLLRYALRLFRRPAYLVRRWREARRAAHGLSRRRL